MRNNQRQHFDYRSKGVTGLLVGSCYRALYQSCREHAQMAVLVFIGIVMFGSPPQVVEIHSTPSGIASNCAALSSNVEAPLALQQPNTIPIAVRHSSRTPS